MGIAEKCAEQYSIGDRGQEVSQDEKIIVQLHCMELRRGV